MIQVFCHAYLAMVILLAILYFIVINNNEWNLIQVANKEKSAYMSCHIHKFARIEACSFD